MATLDTDDLQSISDIITTKLSDYFASNVVPIDGSTLDLSNPLSSYFASNLVRVDSSTLDLATPLNTYFTSNPVTVDLSSVNSKIDLVKQDTTTLKADTVTLKADTTTLKADTVTLKADATTLKVDTETLLNDTSGLLEDLGNVAQNVTPFFTADLDGNIPLNTVIDGLLLSIDSSHNVDISTLDLTPLEDSIISVITQNVSGIIADASLNGYGSEFKDGDLVTVTGRDVVYAVARSFFSIYSENAYTIHYAVASQDGQRLIVPEALLERYVAPVTTTP